MDYDAIIITAGAGMGVDSGLPDFRGSEGFWKAYPVIKDLGYSFAEMANPIWFHDDPELAWAFYGHRLNLYRETLPHEGFLLLLEYADSLPNGYAVITSNVDGHFEKAGFDPNRIEEIHGSIHHFQCSNKDLCSQPIYSAPEAVITIDETSFKAQTIPKCPSCGDTARPNIMMFGDWSWDPSRTNAQEKRIQSWLKELIAEDKNVVIVEVGAGTAIPSIRYTTEQLACQHGATYYRVNPREAEVDQSGVAIPMNGLEGIRAVLRQIRAD